jgi:hypothetical protein
VSRYLTQSAQPVSQNEILATSLTHNKHILSKFDVRVTVHRKHYIRKNRQLTALRYTTQMAYRFGHQKAVLTNVLLKMGIIMLETC